MNIYDWGVEIDLFDSDSELCESAVPQGVFCSNSKGLFSDFILCECALNVL